MAKKDAEKADAGVPAEPPTFSEKDKAKARAWFKKADSERDKRAYDYAIECYITGLTFWPEAVDEGYMPLWALAIQRQQAGGKKPGMMESMKTSTSGKDAVQALLNAAMLLAKDPRNNNYLDALQKNANRAMMHETLKWISPKVLESLRRDEKPNAGRCKGYRQVLVEAADRAEAWNDPITAGTFLEGALQSLDYQILRNPSDMALKDEQRNLSGRLTILKGKYTDADTFRESLHDGAGQKLLHDAERVKQGEQTLSDLAAAARQAWKAEPESATRVSALVETLLKFEREAEESEAIEVLEQAYAALNNYSYKARADDIRLKQLRRTVRDTVTRARETGSDDDRQQARLAAMEEQATTVEIYRERAAKYPTDLKVKFRLGEALFRGHEYDEAIPLLQAAQAEPKSRASARLMLGRAFIEKGAPREGVQILEDAIEDYELPDDEMAKRMTYWLGRAAEEAGDVARAKTAYGRLLRIDYNFADGDARKRLDELNKRPESA